MTDSDQREPQGIGWFAVTLCKALLSLTVAWFMAYLYFCVPENSELMRSGNS